MNLDPAEARPPSTEAFLAGGGEMGERIRNLDWSRTPLGPTASWPQSLRSAVSILLPSKAQIVLFWGPDLTTLYNDAYRPVFGGKHPRVLGLPARESWSELWEGSGLRALFEGVLRTGEAFWASDRLFVMERFGYTEETYFDVSYDPVRDETGQVAGLFCIVNETTPRVVSERRLKTLRDLAARTVTEAWSVEAACLTAAQLLADNLHDLPFSLLYLLDADAKSARLLGASGLAAGARAAPAAVELGAESGWPLDAVLQTRRAQVVTELGRRFGPLPGGVWPEPTHSAVVLPIAKPGQERLAGFLVAGVSPRRALDEAYRDFLNLVAGHVATSIANAQAYEEEKKRAEALAELDRAKTAFFSNVSHEFRTPLTLLLGPVEDLLARSYTDLPPAAKGELEVVHRNSLRLLKLVNTLLDFSRIEAGRVQARYEPTDLAAYTSELASTFRSACERGGLRLKVQCPPLPEPVYVDRDLWEKVVLNLLSNAFKFTLQGEIEVALGTAGAAAELTVRDTGVGIPAEELTHLFERFHRAKETRGRTHEGTGIGLALVQELVKLHGGSVRVASAFNEGSTFTVTVPFGTAHLPADQVKGARTLASTSLGASPYVEEALRWLPGAEGEDRVARWLGDRTTRAAQAPAARPGPRPRVLWADDNADMREYVRRLFGERYEVEEAADGEQALAAARARPPDLVLSDVMMPKLDGFGLLEALRADERTRAVPVILLSARAGEESRVEGMEAGADDYLVKPFSARELLARVGAHLEMARVRREAARREQELRAEAEAATARVERVLNSVSDQFLTLDRDWRYTYVNDRMLEATGRRREELLGRVIWEVFPDAVGTPFEQQLRRAAADGVAVHFEYHHSPWDRWFENHVYPSPEGVTLFASEVTDRKRAEQAQRRTEQRFRLAADAVNGIIYEFDLQTGKVERTRGLYEVLGYRPDEVPPTAQWWRDQIHPDDRPKDDDGPRIDAAAAAGGTLVSAYRVRHRDGRWLFVEDRAMVMTEAGRPVRVIGCTTDVTERRAAEEALKDADRRKDDFLAMLGHELRNPLAPIRNATALLGMAEGDVATVRQARAMIERQAGHMTRLIDDLLDVSRVARGKIRLRRERLDLAALVRSACEDHRASLEASGLNLGLEVPGRPVWVEGDRTRLSQVLDNLLHNAVKFTGAGGSVQVRLAEEAGGRRAAVAVRDTGIGIEPDMLSRLFTPFAQADRTLDRSRGGLGLGLALVRGLVELHAGQVRAASAGPGRGAEFTFWLPTAERPEPPADLPAQEPQDARPCRILVIEDNRDAADSLQLLLRLTGHEVAVAYGGREGVEQARAFHPDVVLCDLGLPGLSGFEVAKAIRQDPSTAAALLVAVTGYGQEEDRRRSRESGFDDHLIKPVDPRDVERLLAEGAGPRLDHASP